jgi:hypothetical protein
MDWKDIPAATDASGGLPSTRAFELPTSIFICTHGDVITRLPDGLAVPEVRVFCWNCIHMHV